MRHHLVPLLGLGACTSPTSSKPPKEPTKGGEVTFQNQFLAGATLRVYSADNLETIVATSGELDLGVSKTMGNVPKGQDLIFKVYQSSPGTIYSTVKDGVPTTFRVSPLRAYVFEWTPDSNDVAKPVWRWRLADDAAFLVSNLKATAGASKLTVTWTDPAMDDLSSILVTVGSTTQTVAKGVQTATFTGLTAGVEVTVKAVVVYPEIQSVAASTKGKPLAAAVVPSVVSTSPADQAVDVKTDTKVSAVFSTAVTSVDAQSFQLWKGTTAVAGAVTLDGTTATFTPSAALEYSTSYRAVLTTAIESTSGGSLAAEKAWTFTTGAKPLFQAYAQTSITPKAEVIAVGDVTGDGKADLLAHTWSGSGSGQEFRLLMYPQTASGLGTPVSTATEAIYTNSAKALALGNFAGDATPEVVVFTRGYVEVYQWMDEFFGRVISASIVGIEFSGGLVVDLDGDGRDDLVAVDHQGGKVWVWYQKADKTLEQAASVSIGVKSVSGMVRVGDVNDDGRLDLVAMGTAAAQVVVKAQTASRQFGSDISTTLNITSSINDLAVGDVTGDQIDDVVVAYGGNKPASGLAVLAGSQGSLATAVTHTSHDIPSNLVLADFDNDGLVDVGVRHAGWDQLGVYLQKGGTLKAEQLFATGRIQGYSVYASAAGDLNGDGKTDAAVASDAGVTVLYGL